MAAYRFICFAVCQLDRPVYRGALLWSRLIMRLSYFRAY